MGLGLMMGAVLAPVVEAELVVVDLTGVFGSFGGTSVESVVTAGVSVAAETSVGPGSTLGSSFLTTVPEVIPSLAVGMEEFAVPAAVSSVLPVDVFESAVLDEPGFEVVGAVIGLDSSAEFTRSPNSRVGSFMIVLMAISTVASPSE
jgi:hypothetical protein